MEPDLTIGGPYAFLIDLEEGRRPYEPPTPLYKHCRREHGLILVNEGKVRISSLDVYRSFDAAAGSIVDASEGKQRTELVDADMVIEHPTNFIGWETWSPEFVVGPRGQVFAHNTYYSEAANNQYVFCLSTSGDATTSKDLHLDYDSIVEVTDPIGLFICLSRHLIANGLTVSPFLGSCIYDGTQVWEDFRGRKKIIPRALQKRSDHSKHAEVRFVFPALQPMADYLDLEVKELCQYLRLLP